MTTAPAPGTAYHRLARTDRHRWWRPLLGTLLILGGTFVLLCLLVGIGTAIAAVTGRPTGPDGLPALGALGDLVLLLAAIAAALPFVLLAARWVQARPAGTVSSVLGRLRWRWLGWCALVAVPAVLLLLGGSFGLLALTGSADGDEAVGTGWPGWAGFLGALVLLLLLVPFQAAAEEYVFRGWLLQLVGVLLRTPWPAIALQAVLFAFAHGWGTGWGFADLMVMGGVLGWLTVRTGGLEAAIALHVVNNLVSFVGAAALGQLGIDETAADAPWEMFVVSLLVNAGYAVAVLRLARRRRLPTVSPERPAPPPGYPAAVPGHPFPAPAHPAAIPGHPFAVPAHPGAGSGQPLPGPGQPLPGAGPPPLPATDQHGRQNGAEQHGRQNATDQHGRQNGERDSGEQHGHQPPTAPAQGPRAGQTPIGPTD
ncbi:CPBP family intramembrane glutamic endopeptidase [Plantactinospora sp. BB1]|uniref:CPBP family intramembrane glutamic endopeptidase n=1 Tax=Plantactinospora sp. BB1 TaxID=2071627 RepID=UPI000D150DA1|nr:type II CAAX endopeptidase family protein [Plantactinospora sp. BB1]AVT37564.1 CPBP family intramembrane metalloprotease domain-containing protein [Plantactinospora sp. BB1]